MRMLCLTVSGTYAFESDAIKTPKHQVEKETIKEWLTASPVRFLENKGQMTDTDHRPVPSVLFKLLLQAWMCILPKKASVMYL